MDRIAGCAPRGLGGWGVGRHEILHYEATNAESTATWSAVLAALTQRGLDPRAVRMVVSEGTTGLPAALSTYLPRAQQQRCTVHTIRGLERKFWYRDLLMTDPTSQEPLRFEQARRLRRQQLTTDAHAIVAAATRTEAEQRLASFRTTWEQREGAVVRLLMKDIALSLRFYQFDVGLHALVRSTNLLERCFREFRSKADAIGAFPNERTCLTVFRFFRTCRGTESGSTASGRPGRVLPVFRPIRQRVAFGAWLCDALKRGERTYVFHGKS